MHEELIKEKFNQCRVGSALGIEVYHLEEGNARGRMTIREEHINPFNAVHGGILFTFADHIGGACGNTLGKQAVLVESSVQFLKPVFAGETVYCDATLVHMGKKIGRIEIRMYRENGESVAFMHMISFLRDDDHEQ